MTKWILGALLLSTLLAGCNSQLPYAATYPMTQQRKMQAAEHWNILAADVADQVKKALDDRVELRLLAIDVTPDRQGPFYNVFQELLRSQLVFRGLQVAEKDEDQLVLKYKVQVVKHNGRFQRPPPGLLTAIGVGVSVARDLSNSFLYAAAPAGLLLDVASGHLTSHSDQEIVITTSMAWRNRFVVHSSDIYYINDADNLHYGEPIPNVGTAAMDAPPADPLEGLGAVSVGVENE